MKTFFPIASESLKWTGTIFFENSCPWISRITSEQTALTIRKDVLVSRFLWQLSSKKEKVVEVVGSNHYNVFQSFLTSTILLWLQSLSLEMNLPSALLRKPWSRVQFLTLCTLTVHAHQSSGQRPSRIITTPWELNHQHKAMYSPIKVCTTETKILALVRTMHFFKKQGRQLFWRGQKFWSLRSQRPK